MKWLSDNILSLLYMVIIIGGIALGCYIKMQHWNECRQFHGTAYCLFLRRF